MLHYGVPAFWAGLMVWRRGALPKPAARWRLALRASLPVWAGLTIFYWPRMPGFWSQEVWWVEEAAREGMGMMIAFALVVVAWLTSRRGRA